MRNDNVYMGDSMPEGYPIGRRALLKLFHNASAEVDAAEYELILQKKSRLSANERERVRLRVEWRTKFGEPRFGK